MLPTINNMTSSNNKHQPVTFSQFKSSVPHVQNIQTMESSIITKTILQKQHQSSYIKYTTPREYKEWYYTQLQKIKIIQDKIERLYSTTYVHPFFLYFHLSVTVDKKSNSVVGKIYISQSTAEPVCQLTFF